MKTKGKVSGYILRCTAWAVLCSFALVAFSSAFNLSNGLPKPAMPVSASGKIATDSNQLRTLTLADRVAYQRAIEEVYWRHRIWPQENAGPKPPLDKVILQAEIEKKVDDYLRNSQALEDYWQRLITPDQLQGEMERIASHTKQPAVLREIFAELGNDPFVIAECLARPVLTERLITELYAHDQRFHGELKRRAEAELRTNPSVSQMEKTSGRYTEMEWVKSDSAETGPIAAGVSPALDTKNIEAVKMNTSEWQESVEKLAREFGFGVRRHRAAFESADMSAHSKNAAAGQYETLPVGEISPLQEDQGHYYAVAVMKKGKDRLKLATIAWLKEPLRSWLAKAEAQAPVTMAAVSINYTLPAIASDLPDSCTVPWTPTSTTNAPAGRIFHTAVWTGVEMIVWGGWDAVVTYFNTGGRYNPSTDSWTATSTTNAPTARDAHTAVWTGGEMIVWGGSDNNGTNVFNTGGRYNPSTDSWTVTSTTNPPTARQFHTAVWTGSEMIVWGGKGSGPSHLNTGGRYNPSTDAWTATSTTSAPNARAEHTAVWTGSQMIVWGGDNGSVYFHTGARYNPSTNGWTATSTTNAPAGRSAHTAVWAGSQMIVWGGFDGSLRLNTGGKYNPSTNSWTATSTNNAPAGREFHTAVWTGSVMIVWGGGSYQHTGGKYNPGTDSWTATDTTRAPQGRTLQAAVWTGSQMIIWGGIGNSGAVNTGGRYCPAAQAQVILYNQYNNAGTAATVSAQFTDSPPHNSHLADDFVVPGGQTWNVHSIDAGGLYFNGSGPATDWNVFFYTDNAGFPGTQIYGALHKPGVQSGTTFTVNLPTPAVLSAGRYWIEIQANMTFSTGGEWGWTNRTVTSNNAAAWQNPGGGFGLCPNWSRRGATCNIDPSEPDQVFRLQGTIGGVTPTPTPSGTPSSLGNISTRAFVQTGDNVMIGGFIVQGTQRKRGIIRAVGPELGAPPYNIPNALANPTLELHNGTGALIASNDNWRTTIIGGIITSNQVLDIISSGYAPSDGRESAIVADLAPGNYTAIVRGLNNTTGVGLVEVYDLSNDASSILGNISTRTFVQTNDNVMIGGFIVQGTGAKRVIVRAIGPELSQYGVPNPLADPTLELHNGTGALIASNNNWETTITGGIITTNQVSAIQNSGHAPTQASESAIIATLPPGNYTAIVRGVNNTTGVALVEVYDLQ